MDHSDDGWPHNNTQAPINNRDKAVLLPLSTVSAGRVVRVSQLNGGRGLVSRLSAMGIYPGSDLTVMGNMGGPVIVNVKGSRFSLGRGMAAKIMVETNAA